MIAINAQRKVISHRATTTLKATVKPYSVAIPTALIGKWNCLQGQTFNYDDGLALVKFFHSIACPARLLNEAGEQQPFPFSVGATEIVSNLLTYFVQNGVTISGTWMVSEFVLQPEPRHYVGISEIVSAGQLEITSPSIRTLENTEYKLTNDLETFKEFGRTIKKQGGFNVR